jgi:hypothetical protein
MPWSDADRAYYFGCECSPGIAPEGRPATDCLSGDDADDAFLERYCAPDRAERRANRQLNCVTGTATRLAGVDIKIARCVISKLAELVPNADHATPGWNWPDDLLPAVVIGHLDRGLRIRGPRCGLWAENDRLYFWADLRVFQKLQLAVQYWEPFGRPIDPDDAPPLLRYRNPVSCICDGAGEPALPLPVLEFLRRYADLIDDSIWPEGPLVPREVCAGMAIRGAGPSPNGEDPDEEADAPIVETAQDAAGDPDDAAPSPPAASMLEVLRQVLLARIQTNRPGFTTNDLDILILNTGYPPAGAPHSNIADLVFVMAASITNAAGGRPDWREFAPAAVQAMLCGGALGMHALVGPFGVADLARWFANLRGAPPPGGWSQRMNRFLNSAAQIAGALRGNPVALDNSILNGMVGFCNWLRNHHQGDARVLHNAMSAPAIAGHELILSSMAQLELHKGIGVAIAANFLKDSQVPPLVHRGFVMSTVEAGWSAKPDLHVLRLMAKLTRGIPLHAHHRRQSLRVALQSFSCPPIAGAGPGFFPNNYPFAVGRRSEYRAIEDIHHWADAIGTSALQIERVLYLIGARSVDLGPMHAGITVSAAWYRRAEAAIDAALIQGVRRMS